VNVDAYGYVDVDVGWDVCAYVGVYVHG